MKKAFPSTALLLVAVLTLAPVAQSDDREDPTLIKERETFKEHLPGITWLALSPDDRYLATINRRDEVAVWDLKEKKLVGFRNGYDNVASRCVFSRDGKTLATLSRERPIKFWEVPNLKAKGWLGETEPELGHKEIGPQSLAYSVDGKLLACGGCLRKGNGFLSRIKVWEIESGKEIATFKPPDKFGIRCLLFTKDRKTVISGGDDSMLRFWDLESGKEVDACKVGENPVTAMAITKDGTRLVTAGLDEIYVWDVAKRKRVDELFNQGLREVTGHGYPAVESVAFSPDGNVLAAPCGHTVTLFDMQVGKIRNSLGGHKKNAGSEAVAITSDGKTIISAGSDGTIKFWDMPE
jgi:WD40 repeat protein